MIDQSLVLFQFLIGTIKRFHVGDTTVTAAVFQFLIGTIKRGVQYGALLLIIYFNSS